MSEDDILTRLDHPAVNSGIFFPRPDPGRPAPPGSEDLEIDVEDGAMVAARFHPSDPNLPTVLHFHGNGEIVADYDDMAPAFHAAGASLLCADFRGYGKSTGSPSMRGLVKDAHPVLDAVLHLLAERGHTGPLVVMGRSLGSASAIELASSRGDDVAGLVIESGFARTLPLLGLLGITVSFLGLDHVEGDDNEDKMSRVEVPVLLLHADGDMIVPFWHAERNHEHAAASDKLLVTIPDADHNTIIARGGELYWGSIARFLSAL
ncbi:MAG: alpha/beta hydrolase [Deltaproteobacteria bacterium]|nr:alpha/beta hydrolase [Deltaproteobacteria bacterium]